MLDEDEDELVVVAVDIGMGTGLSCGFSTPEAVRFSAMERWLGVDGRWVPAPEVGWVMETLSWKLARKVPAKNR